MATALAVRDRVCSLPLPSVPEAWRPVRATASSAETQLSLLVASHTAIVTAFSGRLHGNPLCEEQGFFIVNFFRGGDFHGQDFPPSHPLPITF